MGPSHVQHFSRRGQVLSTAGLQPAEGLLGGEPALSAASTPTPDWPCGVLCAVLPPQDTGLCHSRPDRGCGQGEDSPLQIS